MKKFMKKAAILAAMAMIAQLVVIPGMAMAAAGGTVAPIGWGPNVIGSGYGITSNVLGNQQLGWAPGNRLASVKVVIPVEEPAAPVEEPAAAPAAPAEPAAAPAEGEAVAAPAEEAAAPAEEAAAPAEEAVAPAAGTGRPVGYVLEKYGIWNYGNTGFGAGEPHEAGYKNLAQN